MKLLITTLTLMLSTIAWCQPRYDFTRLQREQLNRGVVAVKNSNGQVVVSWRTLTSDRKGEPFDVYRNGKKLNKQPLTTSGTFFIDDNPLKKEAVYEVRGGGKNGCFTLKSN